MKKGLLALSLILLFTFLGISAADVLIDAHETLIGLGALGTFLVGAVYPTY